MNQTEQVLKLQVLSAGHKKSLKDNRLQLLENLQLSEKFWTIMMSNDSLTSSMIKAIKAKPNPDDQIGSLVNTMGQRHELAFVTFIRALVETGHEQCANLVDRQLTTAVIAEKALETAQPSTEPTTATTTSVVQPSSGQETEIGSSNPQIPHCYPPQYLHQMQNPGYGQPAPYLVPQQPYCMPGYGYQFVPHPQSHVPVFDVQTGHPHGAFQSSYGVAGPAGDANGGPTSGWRPQLPAAAADHSKNANVDQHLAAQLSSGLSIRSGLELTSASMQPSATVNVQQTAAVLEENVATGSAAEESSDETDSRAGQKAAELVSSASGVIVSKLSIDERIQHYLTAVQPETNVASMKETLQYVLQNRYLWENNGLLNSDAYAMNHRIHGRALIINNEYFLYHNTRDGTLQDEKNIVELLELFGFETFVEKNKCKEDIVKILQRESVVGHSQYDAFVLFILSHGTLGTVFGTDSEKLAVDQIVEHFDSNHCPTLHGKPKVFFFQACQGAKDSVVQRDGVGGDVYVRDSESEVPEIRDRNEQADMLIAHATVRGYAAYRDEFYGSCYVRSLVYVFAHYSHCQHLEEMLTTLNRLISQLTIKVRDAKGVIHVKPIAQKTSSFTLPLYFLPKI